jgi:hypothetical protein
VELHTHPVTLGRKDAIDRIVTGGEPEKPPAVLNREEIVRFRGSRNFSESRKSGAAKRVVDEQLTLLHVAVVPVGSPRADGLIDAAISNTWLS